MITCLETRTLGSLSLTSGVPSILHVAWRGSRASGGTTCSYVVYASSASWIQSSNNNDSDGPQGSEDDNAVHSCRSASEKCAFSEFWSLISHTRYTAASAGGRKLLMFLV